MFHGTALVFEFSKFSGAVLQCRFKVGHGEGHLLESLVSLEHVVVQATLASSQRFVFPVAFQKPALQFLNLFDEVVVLG